MSYARKHLMSGEVIVREAHLSRVIYLPAAVLLALAAVLFAEVYSGGESTRYALPAPVILLAAAAAAALGALVKRSSSEFVVTNKRVLVKTGWLRRRSTEILLRQIEGIAVEQGIVGRVLNYGTIVVEGTGSDRTPYRGISDPLGFRLAVQEQIEGTLAQRNPGAPQRADPPRGDPYADLLKLNELREKGVLTDEEFNREKAKILR
jgi:uncharacterized membrane protein YdbT with pleckstrin-like domain